MYVDARCVFIMYALYVHTYLEFLLDMAAKLHWINESFRRYEIEDLGCQLYIACEAGKIKGEKKSPKIGRITTMIHSMIS